MAGLLCNGIVDPNNGFRKRSADVRLSRSYCEGMTYRTTDFGDVATKAANPHEVNSESWIAWNAGWDLAEANAGGTISNADAGCCALRGASVPASTSP